MAPWFPVTKAPAVSAPSSAEGGPDSGRTSVAEPRWTSLPQRETIGKPAADLFLPQSWSPPPAKRRTAAAAPPPPKSGPEPPTMPYRIAGKLVHEDRSQIVLAKGDAVFPVREGDTLEDGYRVLGIAPDHVTLLYLPLGMRQTIQMTSPFAVDAGLVAASR